MSQKFKIVKELPAGRGRATLVATELVAAANAAGGQWVRGPKYATASSASTRANALSERFPGYEFASRRGVIYCRKAVPQ